MFESFVSDLLNRILGMYIEDLDGSKLKISMWGGDVQLKNLVIKQTALDDLKLPVRPLYGHLESLTIKIPWNKLYTEKWVATVTGFNLLALPETSIVYDEKKEEKIAHDVKMAALHQIEEAKKKSVSPSEKPKDDGFIEKLISQIIRNIQVTIQDIHIRYEDPLACQAMPFSVGIVLQKLSLQSTDGSWKVGLDTADFVYKLMTINGFAIYLTPHSDLLSDKSAEEISEAVKSLKFENDHSNFKLVLGPLNLTSKLQLNLRPELDEVPFSVPKLYLAINLETLSLGLSRYQFASIMSLLDSLDRTRLSSLYKKHRPAVRTISGNARLWWKYVYNCKLENIRRIRKNWSWTNMKSHREKCREYAALYKQKLSRIKLTADAGTRFDQLERDLDMFNIVLSRKHAEMEVEKETPPATEARSPRGWFSSWFSTSSSTAESDESKTSIAKNLQSSLDEKDKAQLYEAIGYSQNGVPAELPHEYVDVRIIFALQQLKIAVVDELLDHCTICSASLDLVECSLERRYAAGAIQMTSSLQSLTVRGVPQIDDTGPLVVESLFVSADSPLLRINLETNPLDRLCDIRLHVDARPLNIVYHSATIHHAKDLFAPPKDVSLQQLQAAAVAKYEVVKEKSVTGLQNAIEMHSILDLEIKFQTSRLVLTEIGKKNNGLVVITLGSVSITSKISNDTSLTELAASGKEQDLILAEMRSSSYDQFAINIEDIQIIAADETEDWVSALTSSTPSPLHLLQPLCLRVNLYRCLIKSDPNLARLKIRANLPEIYLSVTDARLVRAAAVLSKCFETNVSSPSLSQSHTQFQAEKNDRPNEEVSIIRLQALDLAPTKEESVQFIDYVLVFKIQRMAVELLKEHNGVCTSVLKLTSSDNSVEIVQKTFDLSIEMTVEAVSVKHLEWAEEDVVTTYSTGSDSTSLIRIMFCKVNPKSPAFHTVHDSTTELLDIEVSRASVRLEQRILLNLLAFWNDISCRLEIIMAKPMAIPNIEVNAGLPLMRLKSTDAGNLLAPAVKQHLRASLKQIDLKLSSKARDLLLFNVKGLNVQASLQNNIKDISTCLDEFSIRNPSADEFYKDIFVLLDKRAWSARVKLYETVEDDYFDTKKWDVEVEAEIGRSKIVLLYKIMTDVLGWLDKFQAAKDALLSASQAAVQAAKQNLQETYLRCTKVRMALVLKAPVVLVPSNSMLNGGLIVDPGKIVIRNEFRLGVAKNKHGHPCLFDDISFSIENVEICRKVDFSSSDENCILSPVSLILFVKRNLSISWHKLAPEMDVNANLKAVKVALSDDDIKAFYSILKGNLSEVYDEGLKTQLSVVEHPYANPEKNVDEVVFFKKEDIIYNRIIFQFSMQAITLDMFTTENEPLSEDNLLERREFAKFELQALSSKLVVSSNSDLTFDLQLDNCVLKDTREGANGIVTLLEKKTTSDSKESSICEMTYIQMDENATVTGKVAEFLLVLHLPFLLQLRDILTPDLNERSIFEESEHTKKDAVSIPSLSVDENKPPSTLFNIHLKIEKPYIALVEDLRDINSSSIFLHGEIEADMEYNASKREINSKVWNLEMYVACFNEEKRKDTMSRILQKSNVTFLSSADDQNGESSQIKFDRLEFTAAPDYVALLMNIVSCLTVDTDSKSSLKPSLSQDWTNYWEQKPIDYDFLPFLNIDVAEEAFDTAEILGDQVCRCDTANTKRTLTVEWDSILLSLEAGSGQSLVPLLKIQSSCLASVEVVDTRYEIDGSLNLEVVYFNSKQAIWEPLLEPIENTFAGIDEYRPWQLRFQMIYDENDPPPKRSASLTPSEASQSVIVVSETSSMSSDYVDVEETIPVIAVKLIANDPMEFTVTNTSFEVLQHIQEAFMEAYGGKLTVRQKSKAPYKVINKTGLPFTLYLSQSNLQLSLDGEDTQETIEIQSGAEINAYEHRSSNFLHRRHSSLVYEYQTAVDKHVVVRFPDIPECCFVPSIRSEKRFFSFTNKRTNFKFGIVSCVSAKDGCKTILLSSCVEVTNKIDHFVDIYSMNERGNEIDFVCSLAPDEKQYIPVRSLSTPSAELFFGVRGYSVCIEALVWKNLKNRPDFVQKLSCAAKSDALSKVPFVLTAVCDLEQIFWSRTQRKTVHSVMISVVLRPWMQIYNLLPVSFGLSVTGVNHVTVVGPGESTQIDRVHSSNVSVVIEIFSYDSANWLCEKEFNENIAEFNSISFKKLGVPQPETLDLALHMTVRKGVNLLRLFSPFWMLNKTGYDLTYKGESSLTKLHRKENKNPVLFMFRSQALIGKNQASIKLNNSDWSERFPIDTVGSSGSVTCQSGKQTYKISADIQLATSGLTKIVTFSSFYKAINRCPYDLEFLYADESCKLWQSISVGECIGLWPTQVSEGLYVRVKGTIHATSAIHFQKEHSTLFKLPNMYGGVLAEVKVTEGVTLLSLDECVASISTVLVINQLSAPLIIWRETNDSVKVELDGQRMIFFTWESSEVQSLALSCFGSTPVTCVISKNGRGDFGDGEVGWASFIIGAQYCLLVSRDEIFLEGPIQPNMLQRPNIDLEISLQKISLSLVNDELQNELLFMVLTSSGNVWECKKVIGKRWRPFSESQTSLLEKWYQIYLHQRSTRRYDEVQTQYKLEQNLEVNYATMESIKPYHRHIRRIFQPAFWLKYQGLEKSRRLHLKMNTMQIDNQMFDGKFPVVFARTPQPNSIMKETVPKPFLELSVFESLETTGFHCYKCVALLIQEFNLQLELPFLFVIMNTIIPPEGFDFIYTPEKFKIDSGKIDNSLADLVSIQHRSSRRDFYDSIHLSPIKMHLSFSLTSHGLPSADAMGGEFINLFLHSVGVPLTETQDAVFRLGFFAKYNYWVNLDYLKADVISHYTNQVLKQLYVFVLGLDALGNPYGLVLGVTKGFEDLFYEPILGAVEGPGEFAEGLKHGVQSFMGKTVGGAAGAFSKITGTIGKGVASLTMDETYQKQRRDALHRKPADNLENMARVGKGVLSGVTGGVAGVIMKPIEGAKEEGVEGFFKGVFKGGIGLVTRPVSGVVDFASESLDAVVRATDTTTQVTQFRPPRFIGTNGVVRPYSQRYAEGAKFLRELEKGQYAFSDHYVAHSVMSDNRNLFMASDKRLLILNRSEVFGQWKIGWVQCYTDLVEPPLLSPSGIHLSVAPVKKGLFGVFSKDDSFKVIRLTSSAENKYVYGKLTEAYSKACSI